MGGNENIRKGEQAGEVVVVEDLAGDVLEKDTFFFLINIERDSADASGL